MKYTNENRETLPFGKKEFSNLQPGDTLEYIPTKVTYGVRVQPRLYQYPSVALYRLLAEDVSMWINETLASNWIPIGKTLDRLRPILTVPWQEQVDEWIRISTLPYTENTPKLVYALADPHYLHGFNYCLWSIWFNAAEDLPWEEFVNEVLSICYKLQGKLTTEDENTKTEVSRCCN
jgi:hypothetical protein